VTKTHLVDLLDQARVRAQQPGFVALERMTLRGETRSVLFAHPESTVDFPAIRVDAGARLTFGVGVRQTCWEKLRTPVIFRLDRIGPWRRRRTLFELALDPASRPEHRRWVDAEVPLHGPAGGPVRLSFVTRLPEGGDPSYAWAGWSDPVVEGARAAPPTRRFDDLPPSIILITADALRRDMLGCYGHPEIRTPNLDRLAAEGLRFDHARTTCPSTLAAYAALVTGRHPAQLGLNAEWGNVPADQLHLIQALRSSGYQVILAPGEADHLARSVDPPLPAEMVLPTLGRPDQDGAVTTRRLLQRLARADRRPIFVWIQYFDTHPPTRVPQPAAGRYARQVPSPAPDSSWRQRLRAVESALEIQRALHQLRRGVVDIPLAMRLAATADALEGRSRGPDLAEHLRALSRQTPSEAAFGIRPDELRAFAAGLREGKVPIGLVDWLEVVERHLRQTEAELLLPFDSAESMDDAIRMTWAAVSHVDQLVGELLDGLEALGLAERSTIVFTSPHGEAFGERGIAFHHHALLEACLRVPLLLRPAAGLAPANLARRVVRGPISLLDLPATLLEAHGLPVPPRMQSTSRWREILESGTIADHDLFAIGPYATQAAIVRGKWKLIYAAHDHWLSDDWTFRRGESRLLLVDEADEAQDRAKGEPAQAAALRAQLMEWLRLGPGR